MPLCELCRSDIPANVDRCPVCAAPIPPEHSAPMSDKPPASSPNFSHTGYGALGDVKVEHDASQHTTHHTTNTSHVHQKTTQVSGMHPLLVLALVALLILGGVLLVMALRPTPQPLTIIAPAPAATVVTDNKPVIPIGEPAEPGRQHAVTMPEPPVTAGLPAILDAEVGVLAGGRFTPRTSFKTGELLTLRLRVSRSCQVRVLYQPAQGDPMLIFPESGAGSSPVPAGVEVFIPDPARLAAQSPDATAFKLFHDAGSGPPIVEQVVVQVADEPFAAEGTAPAAGTPYRAYPGMTLADARTRGVVRLKGLAAAAAQAKVDLALTQRVLPFSIMP